MNIEQAKNSSRSFYKAFQRCMEQRSLPEGRVQFLAVPAVVCVAFSIELGFKYFALCEGQEISGHELDTLFGKLDPFNSKNDY